MNDKNEASKTEGSLCLSAGSPFRLCYWSTQHVPYNRFISFTFQICREIQTRIGKAHPNLLCLHGWLIPEPGVLHVLMEKADSDVTTALQRGLLPLKSRMKIAVDVANGLKAIHSVHYIEQDIKTDSILVSLQTREYVFYPIQVKSSFFIRFYVC